MVRFNFWDRFFGEKPRTFLKQATKQIKDMFALDKRLPFVTQSVKQLECSLWYDIGQDRYHLITPKDIKSLREIAHPLTT